LELTAPPPLAGLCRRRARRRRYLDYLEECRETLRDAERELRDRATHLAPPVRRLLHIVSDPARLWERRRSDADFLRVRLGTAVLPVREIRIRDDGTPSGVTDPVALAAAHALIRRFDRAPGLPLEVDLDRAGDVSIVGRDRADVLAVARAVVMQTAVFHAPDDVTLAVLIRSELETDWAWARWLPHLLDRRHAGPDGPQPLLVLDARTLDAVLGDDLAERAIRAGTGNGRADARARPRLLVVDDAHGRPARSLPTGRELALSGLGITVVHLLSDAHHEPRGVAHRITVAGSSIAVASTVRGSSFMTHGVAEDVSAPLLEGMARRLAPLRLTPDTAWLGTAPADAASVLGMSDPDAVGRWRARRETDVLRVPIGLDPTGRPVLLDLKDPAGPHGICMGAPGSGKSELLRTLVLALVTTHPPDQLSVLLVHGTGEKTFAPFAGLPHVTGIIDDLAANPSLMTRLRICLESELRRRDAADAPPHLLVVVDDAGNLLTTRPEFAGLMRRIGRTRRVHLLMSAEHQAVPSDTKDLFSYRIVLRMLSEEDSRSALGSPDACYLPPRPGSGFLAAGGDPTRFTALHVSAPLVEESEMDPRIGLVRPMPRFGLPPSTTATEDLVVPTPTTGPTLLTTTAARLVGTGDAVRPIWLRPLAPAVTLDEVGDVRNAHGTRLAGGPSVPLGLLDDPAGPSQAPWLVDLTGHLLVLGGPASGKTTALRTLALGVATTRSPAEVGIYGVDLCGIGMRALLGVPHVRSVAVRADREQLRGVVDEVHRTLIGRERLRGEIVLLVDGWDRLHEIADIGTRLRELLARGSQCGVHVVATAARWPALPAIDRDAFSTRIELRLAVPAESSIDPDLAWTVPASQPGRGLTTGGFFGQIALPRLDGRSDPASSGIAHAAKLIDDGWALPETNASAPTPNRSEH
jgi:S-DNA-T family DNA segregation ATPase FtsK/SpoIIIE